MADEIMMMDSELGIAKNDEMTFSERIVQRVREEGFFSTFPTDNLEGQKLLYKATNASKLLRDFMETPLAITAFVFSPTAVTTEAGDVEQAWATLTDITDYGAARAYLEGDAALSALCAQYAAYDVGNLVTMGEFEGRPISWRVVSQQGRELHGAT